MNNSKAHEILKQAIRAECGKYEHVRIFVNNVGVAYRKGSNVPIHYGLCVGSSDLIGIRSIVITPDMVGQTIGQFVGVEVKTGRGKMSDDQETFTNVIRNLGGIVIVARCLDDIEEIIR